MVAESNEQATFKLPDPRIGDLLGEEVFQPERLQFRVCPGRDRAAAKSVYGDDTAESL